MAQGTTLISLAYVNMKLREKRSQRKILHIRCITPEARYIILWYMANANSTCRSMQKFGVKKLPQNGQSRRVIHHKSSVAETPIATGKICGP